MNITESRDEAFEAIAEMLRSNVKKTKISAELRLIKMMSYAERSELY